MGEDLHRALSQGLRDSIAWAYANIDEALDYAMRYGRGIDKETCRRFVLMYVNDYTLALGRDGRAAIERLFAMAHAKGRDRRDSADRPDLAGKRRNGRLDCDLTVRTLRVAAVGEYENAFKTAQRERAGAIQVLPSPIFGAQRRVLIELAAKYRLPAIYEFRDYVADGGLMSYGPSMTEMFRGLASYVDRILKGTKPEELPVARPATFELVINLKTAKALGVTISPEILGRADEVIK